DLDRIEIARGEKAFDGFRIDMVGVAEIGQLPVERLDRGIGSNADRARLRSDDGVLAIRLIPDRDYLDSVFEGLYTCQQLCFCLMRKSVPGPNRILVERQTVIFHSLT